MKKILIMLAVATIPAIAGGCNCCGLGACPCNPCNWFNRGAYCAPTPVYAPLTAAPCPPVAAPAILPQYAAPAAAPLATAPVMGPPMVADPTALSYAQPQPMYYSDPGCAYVEPGCAYPTAVGYGPAMPMSFGGCETGGCETGCCEGGSYGGEVISTPSVETFVEPTPTPE
jgi:hypothetical protein